MYRLLPGVVLCALGVGYQHYKILDLTTGCAYFTRDGCTQYKETGALQFKDGATGDIITLQSSTRRTNITNQEYLAALGQCPEPQTEQEQKPEPEPMSADDEPTEESTP